MTKKLNNAHHTLYKYQKLTYENYYKLPFNYNNVHIEKIFVIIYSANRNLHCLANLKLTNFG